MSARLRQEVVRQGCPRAASHPVPPHRRPASPALPESQAVCALPSLRPGTTHRGNSVGRVGSVGNKLRNKHLSLPCGTPTNRPHHTPRGPLSPWGVGPPDSSVGSLVLLLNSNLGASTTLASPSQSREVLLAPLRGTRPPRWGSHLLRGFTPPRSSLTGIHQGT